jgi:long-chain fatty acid transport protein
MRHVAAVLATGALLAAAGGASAQQSLQVPIQFDFLNPGARSLALGSAFVAVADDATAAWTNPAGLWNLPYTEVSIEGRYQRFTQLFMTGGRLSGSITGRGQDAFNGPDFADIADARMGPSFVSFVKKFGRAKEAKDGTEAVGSQFKLAAYRHELIRVDQTFSSRGVFQFGRFDVRDAAFNAQRALSIDNYGLSVARPWGPVLLGAGISAARFSLDYGIANFLHESFYEAPDPQQVLFRFTQQGKDWSVGGTAGILVPFAGRGAVGAAFRRGPSFSYTNVATSIAKPEETYESSFRVPDVLAVGVSARPFSTAPHDSWLFTVEYKHVRNSQLRAGYIASFLTQGDTIEKASGYSIADSNEFHVGAEFVLPVPGEPALRGGAWFDPDHSVRYTRSPANDLYDERFGTSLSSGKDLWHYTGGVGLAVSDVFEINIAADVTSRSRSFSTSAIVRFTKAPPPPP